MDQSPARQIGKCDFYGSAGSGSGEKEGPGHQLQSLYRAAPTVSFPEGGGLARLFPSVSESELNGDGQAGDILWQSNEDLKEILVVGGVTVHFPRPPPGVSRKTNGGSWPVNVNHSMNPSPCPHPPGSPPGVPVPTASLTLAGHVR